MYNTTVSNFNKYRLNQLSDIDLLNYAKLIINNASDREDEMNKNNTWANNYKFALASSDVNHIMEHLNSRGLINSSFKFGYVDGEMYGAENIKGLLSLFE